MRLSKTDDLRERRLAACLLRIQQAPDFPAFSRQMREIMSGLSDQEASVQRQASLVLGDYSLTLKVLRTANSMQYNRSGRPVRSATQAIVMIGARAVRDLASALLIFEHYQEHSPRLRDLLLLSMMTANHAREAAARVRSLEPEEAYLCGMLRNLGEVLVAAHCPDEYEEMLRVAAAESIPIASAGLRVLEFSMEELGGAVARHWGMPETIRAGMRASGAPSESLLSQVVAYGHHLTQAVYERTPAEVPAALTELHQRQGARLRLGREEAKQIVEAAAAETRTLFADARVSLDDLRLARQTGAALRDLAGAEAEPGTMPECPAREDVVRLRIRLLQEVEAELARSPADLHQVMLMVLEAGFRGGEMDRAVLCLFDDSRSRLLARVGLGAGVDEFVARFQIPAGERGGALGSALARGTDLVLGGGGRAVRDQAEWLGRFGAEGAALFALRVRGRTLGALYFDRRDRPMHLDPATREFLRGVRDLAARIIATRPAAPARSPEDKAAAVLQLLAGAPAATVCERLGVDAAELEVWRGDFLAGALERLAQASG